MDEMSHFDRERIPERVVHAKGAGTYVCWVGVVTNALERGLDQLSSPL